MAAALMWSCGCWTADLYFEPVLACVSVSGRRILTAGRPGFRTKAAEFAEDGASLVEPRSAKWIAPAHVLDASNMSWIASGANLMLKHSGAWFPLWLTTSGGFIASQCLNRSAFVCT